MQIYTVKDSKAAEFLPPFFVPNEAVARRSVFAAIQDTNHDFSRFQSDYTLHYIGEFEPSTGESITHPPILIATFDEIAE